MSAIPKIAVLLGMVFATSGWGAPIFSDRPPYVVDSLPAPGVRFHVSICFDSSGHLRVLHNVRYQVWTDTLIFRVDTADGRVLDSLSIHLNCMGPWGMAFAYDKFWIVGKDMSVGKEYVYKVDTLGRVLDRFLSPVVPPAGGNGICFEGRDKLWITSSLGGGPGRPSFVYQTDTLGNVLKFVRTDNYTIGVLDYLAYSPKAPGTLFVTILLRDTSRLGQVTTDDTVAQLLREWPSPYPYGRSGINGSTFDNEGYYWANSTDFPWIYKLDLGLTGVEKGEPPLPEFPRQVRLFPPEPTPTPSATMVRFELPGTAYMKLSLVNIAGSRVRVLNEGVMRAEEYRVLWDGRNDQGRRVPSGVYFLKLEALGQSAVQRVVVVR